MINQGAAVSPFPFYCSFVQARASFLFFMDKTSFIRQFIVNAGSSIVSVQFIKADGSLRSLQFNPRDRQEVNGTGKPSEKPSIIRCRDFTVARKQGAGAWRSFDCDRVVSIKANGQSLSF
jgi:hypothetical protein